jgi:RNA polymerase sigma-70 factor, ECF subfamily
VATDSVSADFANAFQEHRADLLCHCYRMVGCFADAEDLVQDTLLRAWRSRSTYASDAPLRHWLMRIATNVCLNVLERQRPRRFPQLDLDAMTAGTPLEELEAAHWITPAPDAQLFSRPDVALDAHEQVSLAFVALLQRLPPKQRAALLLKDVIGWSAQEIAEALKLTLSSVNSALHRARETMAAVPSRPFGDPPADILREYLRCWEEHDLDGLVALMRHDVAFAMPPFATWFRGTAAVRGFLESPRFAAFWRRGLAALMTRANGLPAFAWYSRASDGAWRLHSLHVMRFEAATLAEATNFIGSHYVHGFEMPEQLPSVPSRQEVMKKIR